MVGGTGGEVTHIVQVPLLIESFLWVDCKMFGQHISSDLEAVWDSYIAKLEVEMRLNC